ICGNCKARYAQMLREGVGPRAVAGVVFGGFWIRLLAVIIDGIITGVVNWAIQFAVLGRSLAGAQIAPGANPEGVFAMMGTMGILWLIGVAISATYESLFIAKLGATPGKMALSLKVVRADGSPVGLGRAIGRHFAKYLSGIILGIGYIMAA